MCSVVLFSQVTFSESSWSTVFDPQQSVEAIPGVAAFDRFYRDSGSRFNIKMSSCRYRKSHCGDKMAVRSSYLHNWISCTGKVSSLYWIRAPGESLPVFTIFSVDVLCSYWTHVIEKIRYIMMLSYFPDVLLFFQNVKFCSRKIPLFLYATVPCVVWFRSGPRINIKMTLYQYRKSHCGDKTISRPSYLHNGISYTGKRTHYIESGPCFQTVIHQWYSTYINQQLLHDLTV